MELRKTGFGERKMGTVFSTSSQGKLITGEGPTLQTKTPHESRRHHG
jgi:hypothetical protein